jgi:hypothetical protein
MMSLTFYTLQKPCEFPATATDAAFDGSFGNAENLGYLFVIHILQIAKNYSFAELWRELFEGILDADFEFEAGDVMLLGGSGVGEPVGHGGAVLFAVEGSVEGVGGAVQAGAAEVIDQEVAGEGRDPGLEAALLGVEAGEVPVELEEDVLGEVFGVGAGACEAIADGVDASVLGRDKLLPGLRIAGHALAYQFGKRFVCKFLFCRTFQLCLE